MAIDTANTVFVFDLDDTLYMESDYYHSGIRHVSALLSTLLGGDAENYLRKISTIKRKNVFDEICKDLGLPESVKESLVWSYRLHSPSIVLAESVRDLLDDLHSESAGVCILTDGRLITQSLKLQALGILHIKHYISEDFGEVKPGFKRYKLIEESYPGKDFLYIGDNLAKDFIAPNQLGWTTVGLRATKKNIHPQDVSKYGESHLPTLWVSRLADLKSFCSCPPYQTRCCKKS